MSHPSEHKLESYVLDPEAITAEVRGDLEHHLEQCPACREWVGYLKKFYEQFRRLPFSTSPALQALVDSARPPATVYDLRPFQRSGPGAARPARGVTIMAAASDTLNATRYQRLGVLSSEEEGVVLRLIYDTQDDVVELFLISSEPRKNQHAIVSFPVLHLECVTDLEGRSKFRGVKSVREIEWGTQYAVVRLPVYEIALPATGETSQTVGQQESLAVTASVDPQAVTVRITPLSKQARPITTALLSDGGGKTAILNLEDGRGSLSIAGMAPRMLLRLYN